MLLWRLGRLWSMLFNQLSQSYICICIYGIVKSLSINISWYWFIRSRTQTIPVKINKCPNSMTHLYVGYKSKGVCIIYYIKQSTVSYWQWFIYNSTFCCVFYSLYTSAIYQTLVIFNFRMILVIFNVVETFVMYKMERLKWNLGHCLCFYSTVTTF